MAKYQGHKNWNHWNVSLWINNDEGLYTEARAFIRKYGNRDHAAKRLMQVYSDCGITHTPDGAPYSVSSIRAAMVGM